jgi:hypothetical protein
MKKLALIIPVLLFPFSLFGQNDLYRSKADIFKIDTTFSPSNKVMPSIKPLPDFSIHNFQFISKSPRNHQDQRDLIFPGASRYYAVWPMPKSPFALQPDSTSRNFLIIKDPLRSFGIK